MMNPKKILSLIVIATLLVACGGGSANSTPASNAPMPPVQDALSLKADGKMQPIQFANLSFATSGEVLEVLVKEGDAVKTNDVIARLRSDSQQTAVARAEAGVAVAKASLAKYQEQLPQLIASAEADIQSAQAQVASASAQNNDQSALASAEAALALATANQRQVQKTYDDIIKANKFGPTEEQARLTLETAKRSTAAAQLRLDQLKHGSVQARSNRSALAAAQAQLQAAQANLDELTAEVNGQPNPTYQAALHQAGAELQLAQSRLADTELRAPFAGTIAQLSLKVGETVGAGSPIGTLADFSGWQIVTDDLTEMKAPQISIGQQAAIVFDALPDMNLKGEVQAIGQLYQEKSGDVVYPVKVKLIAVDPSLRWGMIAHVTFARVPPSAAAQPPTAPAAIVTTAEGRILPHQSANLSFQVSGQAAEILIKEGDSVKAGDVIARLKNDSLRAAAVQAQTGVEAAQAAQANRKMQLPKLIAQAEATLKAAQAKQLAASAGSDNQAALLDAQSALAQAQYTQQQFETALDQLYVYDRANGSRAADLLIQLQSARDATLAAQARLDALKTGSLSSQANGAQIKAASAEMAEAQLQLDQLQAEAAGKTADTFGAAIQQAQAALSAAQQTLAETEIRAPFAGTIVQINLNLGEQILAGQAAVVLADLSSWKVETKDLTEFKVPLVKSGQAVMVQADALPDVQLNGAVESISGVSQLNGGDVVYPTMVNLIDNDPRLRWGMTVVIKFQ